MLDPSGAVVPGARLTLTSTAGTVRTSTGNAQGVYRFRQSERRYALTLSVESQNLFNDVNLGIPVGNLNSPLFGRSIDLASRPYTGYGDANRRIDLRMSFSF